MDTKNTILGIFFIAAGMIILFMQSKSMEETQKLTNMAEVQGVSNSEEGLISEENAEISANGFTEVFEVAEASNEFATEVNRSLVEESTIYVIANDYLEVKLTNAGAAIQEIRFLKAKRGEPDSFILISMGRCLL